MHGEFFTSGSLYMRAGLFSGRWETTMYLGWCAPPVKKVGVNGSTGRCSSTTCCDNCWRAQKLTSIRDCLKLDKNSMGRSPPNGFYTVPFAVTSFSRRLYQSLRWRVFCWKKHLQKTWGICVWKWIVRIGECVEFCWRCVLFQVNEFMTWLNFVFGEIYKCLGIFWNFILVKDFLDNFEKYVELVHL